nr:head fiber protein [Chitinophaga hostae]
MKSTKNLNYLATQSAPLISGNGAPDGVITAPPGSIYRRLDGSSRNVLYVKESGIDNTGWVVYYAPGIATTAVAGMVKQSAAMADSGAASVAALVGDFNLLLSKLRTAGMLAV